MTNKKILLKKVSSLASTSSNFSSHNMGWSFDGKPGEASTNRHAIIKTRKSQFEKFFNNMKKSKRQEYINITKLGVCVSLAGVFTIIVGGIIASLLKPEQQAGLGFCVRVISVFLGTVGATIFSSVASDEVDIDYHLEKSPMGRRCVHPLVVIAAFFISMFMILIPPYGIGIMAFVVLLSMIQMRNPYVDITFVTELLFKANLRESLCSRGVLLNGLLLTQFGVTSLWKAFDETHFCDRVYVVRNLACPGEDMRSE